MKRLIFGGIIGALLAYFFDPDHGQRRRNMAQDRFGGTIRENQDTIQGLTQYATTKAQGVAKQATETVKKTTGQSNGKSYDDATLTEKVKTELYGRDPETKGRVSVNVQDGVVQLRGELETPGQIELAEKTAKSIEGVDSVENLLHLPGAPAPQS